MVHRFSHSLLALAALTPFALAHGGGDDDLDKLSLPAVKGEVSIDFKPGSGLTIDGGDEYSLNILNQLQVQWLFFNRDKGPDVQSFRVRRARTRLSGHVFSPETRYVMQLEWTNSGGNALDMYMEQDLWENEEWSLIGRAGQMKTLYGKEAAGLATGLMFTERSLAARSFSDTRVAGGLAQLTGMDNHLFIHAGVFNAGTARGSVFTSGHLAANPDNELNFTAGARYEFGENMGDITFLQGDLARSEELQGSVHANLWLGNERSGGNDVDVFSYNVGGAVKTGGIGAMAEFFGWNGDPDTAGGTDEDATGFNVQVTYIAEGDWGFGGRISQVSVDNASSAGRLFNASSAGLTGGGTALTAKGEVWEYSLGVTRFYNGHKRKVQADITFQNVDPDSGGSQDNILFRIMATLNI